MNSLITVKSSIRYDIGHNASLPFLSVILLRHRPPTSHDSATCSLIQPLTRSTNS